MHGHENPTALAHPGPKSTKVLSRGNPERPNTQKGFLQGSAGIPRVVSIYKRHEDPYKLHDIPAFAIQPKSLINLTFLKQPNALPRPLNRSGVCKQQGLNATQRTEYQLAGFFASSAFMESFFMDLRGCMGLCSRYMDFSVCRA